MRALVEKSGSGNVNDLLREGRRLPTGPSRVPSPASFSTMVHGDDVITVAAWYLQGRTPNNDAPLMKMAGDIYLPL